MREDLFPTLEEFFRNFSEKCRELGLQKAECGDCGRCCQSPPFLMTTSDLEFAYVQRYVKMHRIPVRIHFEVLDDEHPDKREVYVSWTCPLYSYSRKCMVHPARPFACRIFGPLAQGPIEFEPCVFSRPMIYKTPLEIPLWNEYAAILRQYPFKRGYLFPDQILFNAPILELLMNYRLPWSRWKALQLW